MDGFALHAAPERAPLSEHEWAQTRRGPVREPLRRQATMIACKKLRHKAASNLYRYPSAALPHPNEQFMAPCWILDPRSPEKRIQSTKLPSSSNHYRLRQPTQPLPHEHGNRGEDPGLKEEHIQRATILEVTHLVSLRHWQRPVVL